MNIIPEIKELNIENLSDVLQLQDKIIAGFKTEEKHFILKRSVQDFIKALDSLDTHMIGIFDQGKLIAQSIFEFPQNNHHRDMEEFASNIPNNDLVIFKATLVDKDYRGQGLMQQILSYREQKALQAGKKIAISQIAIDNPSSWINALKSGMTIRKVDNDPYDNAKVLYMQKELGKKHNNIQTSAKTFEMFIGNNIQQTIPLLFNKMKYLAQNGYRGIAFNKENKSIIWQQSSCQHMLVHHNTKHIMLSNALGKTTQNLL